MGGASPTWLAERKMQPHLVVRAFASRLMVEVNCTGDSAGEQMGSNVFGNNLRLVGWKKEWKKQISGTDSSFLPSFPRSLLPHCPPSPAPPG